MKRLIYIQILFLLSCTSKQYAELDNMGIESETEAVVVEDSQLDIVVAQEENPDVVRGDSLLRFDVLSKKKDKFSIIRVSEGDTLMLIAFRLYGDLDRWTDIMKWNNLTRTDQFKLVPGQELIVRVEQRAPGIYSSTGSPYLIAKNDTLQKISSNVYDGTTRYWQDIWQNNKTLIADPNIIFAGFTIYYRDLVDIQNSRQMASE